MNWYELPLAGRHMRIKQGIGRTRPEVAMEWKMLQESREHEAGGRSAVAPR
jgi:hypothetical protein